MTHKLDKAIATEAKMNHAPLRFVTATSLFDGHDAAINIMRRILQQQGVEVIHLGHNRSVDEVVRAALQEDADGIAVSSYQGGHLEYFKYMIDELHEHDADHIRVFGGGGGTITPDEIAELHSYGVERIYAPHDAMAMGLVGMIQDLMQRTKKSRRPIEIPVANADDQTRHIAQMLTALETNAIVGSVLELKRKEWQLQSKHAPVIGITGTGGAGKSSVTDELLNRFTHYFPEKKIAVLAVDPSKRRTGGALLGDRIRINTLRHANIYMRSIATRREHQSTSVILADAILFLQACCFDLILLETAGIGQSDTAVVDLVDFSLYVMTSDYGAASQLEKIDMLDYADLIVLNKYDKRGAEDALRDIRKQWRRDHIAFDIAEDMVPVYPTIASQYNDAGMNYLFSNLCRQLQNKLKLDAQHWSPEIDVARKEPRVMSLIPGERIRYLAEIAEQGRKINAQVVEQSQTANELQHYYEALKVIDVEGLPVALEAYDKKILSSPVDQSLTTLRAHYQTALTKISDEARELLKRWPERKAKLQEKRYVYRVRDMSVEGDNFCESLSHQQIPRVAAPHYEDWGNLLRFLLNENLPGSYPYTAGVYPYRRTGEDPARMFAGEGTPERTNRRFHYLSEGQSSVRLSTAFDSVTLYGEAPTQRPDVYGKIGNSGVSIATLDDMKKLYSGFDLCAPNTSVSMTINGPAPIILAFFMNTAIDQQVEKYLKDNGLWREAEKKIRAYFSNKKIPQPVYQEALPKQHNGLGLGLLGISGEQLLDAASYQRIKADTLAIVRGTVQADILKEDQAQNTCIFSTEFALRMMGDVQQYFIEQNVRNYYSISISGYHIAEAGANPISQLAFTLSNGFTIVEYYLARGMKIDDFAPSLSFFFSNGMDPEYAVLGRVARRIWARAMKERYHANARSQMLKYHIQTSGRSLHAQEIQFNDIRTTLQALYAIFDRCNSLHTNAYDEAITTPTEDSVRRALAIQLIINQEMGLNFNENPWQGSFIIEELTDLVEEAVYKEFDRISARGGVLGAMDTLYQRGKIQEESMVYEQRKYDGSLPIIGVNTFKSKLAAAGTSKQELSRSTDAEKCQQIAALSLFQQLHADQAKAGRDVLQALARKDANLFEVLMETVKSSSLGQITQALYEVGGEYRRNM